MIVIEFLYCKGRTTCKNLRKKKKDLKLVVFILHYIKKQINDSIIMKFRFCFYLEGIFYGFNLLNNNRC